MAPIHHHYEQKGWPEPRIIVRFWIISLLLALVALSSIKGPMNANAISSPWPSLLESTSAWSAWARVGARRLAFCSRLERA